MAEGSMGGKPSGSMLPAGFVEDRQREKELSGLEEATGKQDRVEDDKEEQREKKRKKKIDSLLPDTVVSAYGEITYKQFKEIYDDVFEGVKEKDHWATGFVTHETHLPGGTPIKMRNFRRSEGDAIRALSPRTSIMDGGSAENFDKENSRFVAVRVLVSLMEFDGKERVPLPTLTLDDTEKWLTNDGVKKGVAFLDNMPDQIVTYLDAVVTDIMVAYNAAATENLKNQLAPLSDSTE